MTDTVTQQPVRRVPGPSSSWPASVCVVVSLFSSPYLPNCLDLCGLMSSPGGGGEVDLSRLDVNGLKNLHKQIDE